jgi:hypothetical protein
MEAVTLVMETPPASPPRPRSSYESRVFFTPPPSKTDLFLSLNPEKWHLFPTEHRVDTYFLIGNGDFGLKMRENLALELKQRRAENEADFEPQEGLNWAVEAWSKVNLERFMEVHAEDEPKRVNWNDLALTLLDPLVGGGCDPAKFTEVVVTKERRSWRNKKGVVLEDTLLTIRPKGSEQTFRARTICAESSKMHKTVKASKKHLTGAIETALGTSTEQNPIALHKKSYPAFLESHSKEIGK